MRSSHILIVLALALLLDLPAAHAQGRGQGRGQRIPLETLKTTATIKGVSPRMLQVIATDGREWLVSLPTNLENLVFRATATPDWLRPGMTIRFQANVPIEKRKREITLKQPITALTVATLRPNVGMGIFPESGIDQRNELFGGGQRDAEKKQALGEPTEVSCLIIGRLTECKDGRLRIAAGGLPVKAQLSQDAEVSVEVHDVMWVQPEDQAEITARYFPGRMGQAEGQQVTITAAKPLSGSDGVEKVSRRASRGRKTDETAPAKDEVDKDEVDKDNQNDQDADNRKDKDNDGVKDNQTKTDDDTTTRGAGNRDSDQDQ